MQTQELFYAIINHVTIVQSSHWDMLCGFIYQSFGNNKQGENFFSLNNHLLKKKIKIPALGYLQWQTDLKLVPTLILNLEQNTLFSEKWAIPLNTFHPIPHSVEFLGGSKGEKLEESENSEFLWDYTHIHVCMVFMAHAHMSVFMHAWEYFPIIQFDSCFDLVFVTCQATGLRKTTTLFIHTFVHIGMNF